MGRTRVNISIDEELLGELDEYIASTYKYSDRSTFIEYAVSEQMKKEKAKTSE